MALRALLLLTLVAGAAAADLGEKPITKIVNLLKDMQSQLDTEAAQDQDMYDKLTCWCETNDKEKTKAIADGEQKIKELTATIEEATAAVTTAAADIEDLTGDVEKLSKALAEAAELREKENGEFTGEEKDAAASIQSLGGAVTALSKANSAFAQREALVQVSQVLRRRPEAALAATAPHQRAQIRSLLSAASPTAKLSLLQQSSGLTFQSSAPASGAIFGILKQMKESFETNLETSRQEEGTAVEQYANLKSAKSAEIKAAQGKIFTKKEELAKNEALKQQSKRDLADTENTLAADTEFLANLKKQCANIDAEFEERTKARQEEIAAVSETIGILTSDEAVQAFSKSDTLIQLRQQSRRETERREATATYLAKAGRRLNSPPLSLLAVRVRSDVFGKIKENIDNMVGQLDKTQKDEEVHKDDCNTELKDNGKQTGERNHHKEDVETEINDLEAEIAKLTEEADKLKVQISDTQIEIKRAGEVREEENKDFQTTVADQRATQTIVKKAKERMQQVYAKLVQMGSSQTPPGSFGGMSKNGGGQGVMMLLDNVIQEAVEVEKDALHAENEAQENYESFIKDSNTLIEESSRQLTNIAETIGQDTQTEVDDEGDKRHTVQDIRGLHDVADTLHEGCDWDLEHFDERKGKRSEEMEALKNSKAIFSGAIMAQLSDRAGDDA